ncbi:MAG: glycerophosphodiester phosphodiesterase family protein [Pseudomonadota bacterium]
MGDEIESISFESSADVRLGPRPFNLLAKLSGGDLKATLQSCAEDKISYVPSLFSIGHRGAPLLFPEHTKESYEAAARMGAGILECDVTFTKDQALVCRHAQCDLHDTTDIVLRPDLSAKCTIPPAVDPATGVLLNGRQIKCCSSDLTLAEFKTLVGKRGYSEKSGVTRSEYVYGSTASPSDLSAAKGTVLSLDESIALFEQLGVGHIPELKGPDPQVGFADTGLDQESYARKMIGAYSDRGIDPRRVWAQSFNLDDVLLWIKAFPDFADQLVLLDGRDVENLALAPPRVDDFDTLRRLGVRIIAPPMPVLLHQENGEILPSLYARRAKEAGLQIMSWTTERSGRIVEDVIEGGGDYYYQTTRGALKNDGDILRTIHVLAQHVGIAGLFSDWPATTTFYANCMGMGLQEPGQ